jgi:non-heme chloroperoxidase
VKELTDHLAGIVKALPESLILIGHSFGELIVLQLLARGLGRGGVALDSAAPEGVLAVNWNILRSGSAAAWL